MRRAILGLALALSLAGCKSMELAAVKTVGTIAQTTSTPIPNQVEDLAAAFQAATLVTQATKVYVDTVTLSSAQLRTVRSLSSGVRAALGQWRSADANGQSVAKASFNAALAAFNAYKGG